MPAEGRDLTSRQVWPSGEPSDWCRNGPIKAALGRSEASGCTACESERVADLSVLRVVRQGVSGGHAVDRAGALPSKQGSGRRGWADVRRHRSLWPRPVVGRTGAGTESANLQTERGEAGGGTKSGGRAASAWCADARRPRGGG